MEQWRTCKLGYYIGGYWGLGFWLCCGRARDPVMETHDDYPPPLSNLINVGIPIIMPIKGREFINHGSTLHALGLDGLVILHQASLGRCGEGLEPHMCSVFWGWLNLVR